MRLPRRAGRAAGLGVLALAMINVAAMVSPRNLPMMAEYGWSLIFFVLLDGWRLVSGSLVQGFVSG